MNIYMNIYNYNNIICTTKQYNNKHNRIQYIYTLFIFQSIKNYYYR